MGPKKCRRSGKTRVKPVPKWKHEARNRRRRLRRLIKRVKKMAAEPGAPLMGFVCVIDGVTHLHGSTAFAPVLKAMGKAVSSIKMPTDATSPVKKKSDQKKGIIDFRGLDPYIKWAEVSSLKMLRMCYSRIIPRKDGQRYPSYAEDNKPAYWPEAVPFVSHSRKGATGGRLITAEMMRMVLAKFAEFCLEGVRNGLAAVNVPDNERLNDEGDDCEDDGEDMAGEKEEDGDVKDDNIDDNDGDDDYDNGGGDDDDGGGDDYDEGGGDDDDGGGDYDEGGGDYDEGGGDYDEGGGDYDEGGGDYDEGGGDYDDGDGDFDDNDTETEGKQKRAEKNETEDEAFQAEIKLVGFERRAFLSKNKRFKSGNETLDRKDLDSLKGRNWLIDKVVNAYLSILQKENNISTKGHIFVFPSYLAELWGRQNCKEQELLSYAKIKVQLAAFTWIFMPVNVDGNHWVLLAASPQKMEVSVLDSLGGRHTVLYRQWRKFMKLRAGVSQELEGTWRQGNMQSGHQHDNNNCGSFVLMNALALTKGYDPSLLTRKSAISMRNHAMEKIIGHAKSMDCAKAQCEAPQCSGPKNDQSVSCDICSRWCHFICANVTGRSRDGFLCPICKAQYE